jgi:membrane-bound serine protease (ClpP class)
MFKQAPMLFMLLAMPFLARAQEPAMNVPTPAVAGKAMVYVIPVKDEIGTPILYIMRRGLKEAIERKADAVVIDMDTPGGDAGVMLEIMEALDKFPGQKITYVNSEAISAGAIIASVSDEIYFAPNGIMGAADVVKGTGEDLPEAMKRKVDSYLSAKIEVYSRHAPRRADVIKAMRIPDYELKLDEKVIKAKGELLTVTAEKAMALYGEPPAPLLAKGIAENLDALLATRFAGQPVEKVEMEISWSEKLAQYLNAISSVLLGLGMLALFIEFKTPGFGIFGIAGIALLAAVFLSNYVAGFSGHEPLLLFSLGLILVIVELLFFPGIAVMAIGGLLLMLGSLVWAMADLWPGEPLTVAWSGDAFVQPLRNVGLGLALAVLLGAALIRFLPKGWVWDKMVIGTAIAGSAQLAGINPQAGDEISALVGRRGIAVTMLRPSGQIEIGGRRYEAKVDLGGIDTGEEVVVRGCTDFGLIVEKLNS